MPIEATGLRWRRIAAAPPEEVSLAEGALLVAAEAYPALEIDHYLARVDEMSLALRRRLRPDIGTTEALIALNRFVFDELGFRGNAEDYYDPRNSFLNEVIERRLGIPITLSVLYIEIGRRIGLPLHGVSFPGHFLVRCAVREGTAVLDPYAGGASLSAEDLVGRLQTAAAAPSTVVPALTQTLLAPAHPRVIIARILRNLRAIYEHRGEHDKALAASDRIVLLLPQSPEAYLERAQVYLALDCARGAIDDLQSYLLQRPGAPDAHAVRQRIAALEPRVARLH